MPEPELEPPLLRSPATPAELFRVFNHLALQGFGGVLPVAQRVLVEQQRWLSREQFVETLSLGQVLPGPNIVNMALMIGDRFFGLRGALAALGGLLTAPLLIVLALAALYGQLSSVPAVAGALRGMGAVSAGLIVGTAINPNQVADLIRGEPMRMVYIRELVADLTARNKIVTVERV